ncbi:hypothetical protein, partial [Bacteroides uniformis]|uniref:hypothetical protein n=1 Tax=Bacteroides uniformis TaxID=820 RepID=UPI0039B53DA7
WQNPGQHFVAQELIKIIINHVAELRYIVFASCLLLFISQCKGTTHFHKKRKAKIEEVTVISSFYAICEKKSITSENIQ